MNHPSTARQRFPAIFAVFTALIAAGAFLAPGVPFIVDGGMYQNMAASLVEDHALAVGANGGVNDAPALVKHLTVAHDGLVTPQYPSGYAFLAAPFYALFGVHGLMLMNALAFVLCVFMTHRLAAMFYEAEIARNAALLFAIGTFAPTYMYGVWPQMTALAFYLGAFFLAAKASNGNGRGRLLFVAAGLLIGLGINVRVDLVLAGIAIFFWLRLFALPKDRIAPLMLAAGAIPGLLIAAALNQIKFGVFTPFSYGDRDGLDSAHRYLAIGAAGGAVIAALWAINGQALYARAISKPMRRYAIAGLCLVVLAALAVSPLRDFAFKILKGAYVLVINLQAHDAYYQAGVERNEFGQLMFWGYPKKALIQSLPWLALIIIPAWQALRGRQVSATALCFLAAAAPIAFYAMNQWHGGGSYSMRYFLPAAPFLAILAMTGFHALQQGEVVKRETLLIMLFIAGSLYLGLQEFGHANDRWLAPASLYPQWVIAASLAAAIIAYLATGKTGARRTGVVMSLFAFAYAAALNLYEEITHERTRAEQQALADAISAPIPDGALVLTPMQIMLIPAEARGAFVMATQKRWADAGAEAAMTFRRAGRCVYFHNSFGLNIVAEHLTAPVATAPLWAPSTRFGDDPRLAFFTFQDAPALCRNGFVAAPSPKKP